MAPAYAKKKRPAKHMKVQTIQVQVQNVFDPEIPSENYWPYRVANIIHIRTRAAVIRRQLLMRPGDIADPDLFDESERNLRALPFVKSANIQEIPRPSGDVDLVVKTQDTWTLKPQLNFGTQGNQSTFSTGIEEDNFLGYGKSVTVFYTKDQNGVSRELGYVDPQIGNTRLTLNTDFKDTSTGDEEHVNLQQPFYSLESRWSAGMMTDRVIGVQKVYQSGNEINEYTQRHLHLDPSVGMRLNDDPENVHRLTLRFRYTKDDYLPDSLTQPNSLPANNTLSGPLLVWNFIQSQFIKETFIDKAERVEDFNLGHQLTAETGYSGRAMGATDNSVPYSVNDGFGFGGEGQWFGLASLGLAGRYNTYASNQIGGRPLNTLYFGNLNVFGHLLSMFPLTGVAHMEATYLQNPDIQDFVQLGGDTGLRGYPVKAFTGDKSVLANLETRFYAPYEVLHLAYIGGAAFVDAGQVQPQGVGFNRRDLHADVGAGFRFALTRSTIGTVYRVDFAYAVGPVQQTNRWVVSLTAGQGFGHNNNSAPMFPEVTLPN